MKLLLLQCPTCGTPLDAHHQDQVVACVGCPTHVVLGDDGLRPIDVHYAQSTTGPTAEWEPLWVFEGQVTLQRRSVQEGARTGKTAQAFWSVPRRFFIPAGKLSAGQIRAVGLRLLTHQPPLLPLPAPPPAGRMRPAILSAADAAQFAEFLVLDLEAERRDMLRDLQFDLALGDPTLWAVANLGALRG